MNFYSHLLLSFSFCFFSLIGWVRQKQKLAWNQGTRYLLEINKCEGKECKEGELWWGYINASGNSGVSASGVSGGNIACQSVPHQGEMDRSLFPPGSVTRCHVPGKDLTSGRTVLCSRGETKEADNLMLFIDHSPCSWVAGLDFEGNLRDAALGLPYFPSPGVLYTPENGESNKTFPQKKKNHVRPLINTFPTMWKIHKCSKTHPRVPIVD